MKIINAKELRLNMKKVLEAVRDGEEYLIIYKSKPYARLLPEGKKEYFELIDIDLI